MSNLFSASKSLNLEYKYFSIWEAVDLSQYCFSLAVSPGQRRTSGRGSERWMQREERSVRISSSVSWCLEDTGRWSCAVWPTSFPWRRQRWPTRRWSPEIQRMPDSWGSVWFSDWKQSQWVPPAIPLSAILRQWPARCLWQYLIQYPIAIKAQHWK